MFKLQKNAYVVSMDLQIRNRGSLYITICALLLSFSFYSTDTKAKFSLKSEVDHWNMRLIICNNMIFPNHSVSL